MWQRLISNLLKSFHRHNLANLILAGILAIAVAPAHATVTLADSVITIDGTLENADADRFIELAYGKKVDTVIFNQSAGGAWQAGLRIGNWLVGRKVTTIVQGYCVSACAMAFLGGERRLFARADPRALIAFHLPFHSPTDKTVETLRYSFFSWIAQRTQKTVETLDPAFVQAINSAKNPLGSVAFLSAQHPTVLANGGQTIICRGDEADLPFGCQRTDVFGARSLGIITE